MPKVTSSTVDLVVVLSGVSGVAHVASVLSFESDPNNVTPPVVSGAVNAATTANAFDGGPVQPRTIGLDQSVQMTKQLVWDLDQLVQHLDRLFGLLVETVCRV